MALVPAQCTKCGANLEVDDTQEAAVCKFCGTPFIVEKAINNYNVTNNFAGANVNIVGGNVKNLISIAKQQFADRDYDESKKYFLKALEIEPKNVLALYGKNLSTMLATGKKDIQIFAKSTIDFVKNAKKITDNEDVIFCLDSFAIVIDGIFRMLNAELQPWYQNVYFEPHFNEYLNEVIMLFEASENMETFFNNQNYSQNYKEQHKNILNILVNLTNDICSTKMFTSHIGNTAIPAPRTINADLRPKYVEAYDKYKAKLSQFIDVTDIKDVNRDGHCYIATAVYGSYDCPQVWTFRRYRDAYLSKTFHGRFFIKIYYLISPQFIKLFGKTKWFNIFFRKKLDKIYNKLLLLGYKDIPYID